MLGTAAKSGRRRLARYAALLVWAGLALFALGLTSRALAPAAADSGGDRTLWLYHTHTREEGRFTFRKNGRYDPKVLAKLDYFLRDWRNNKVTHMDPKLFDLLWTIYQEVDGKAPINIVSSYRSPSTNAFLRRTTTGVAKNSQHIQGRAMDIFIPGVPIDRLRAVAMRLQVGGVGYYPHSGSPFVHVDVASVRAWPRMTTAQLRRIFPEGRTLHLPADGVPLSKSGRAYAMAQWKACHTVPCGNGVLSGGPIGPGRIEVARAAPADMRPAPVERRVATVALRAPVPAARPDDLRGPEAGVDTIETASIPPVPATMSRRLMLATRATPGEPTSRPDARTAIAALAAPEPAARPEPVPAATVVAYAPPQPRNAEAEQALRAIIARAGPPASGEAALTAELPKGQGPDIYAGLLDMTWQAVDRLGQHPRVLAALKSVVAPKPIAGLQTRAGTLVAPDLEHAAEMFDDPARMTSAQYAELYEPDEADLNPAAELGPLVNAVYFAQDTGRSLSPARFTDVDPLKVASR